MFDLIDPKFSGSEGCTNKSAQGYCEFGPKYPVQTHRHLFCLTALTFFFCVLWEVCGDASEPIDGSTGGAVDLLDSLVERREDIPSEDRDLLYSILGDALSDEKATVMYGSFSEIRKRRLNEHIAETVNSYPKGPYLTAIQREFRALNFRLSLKAFFYGSVFPCDTTGELFDQMDRISDVLMREAEKRYPDIVGTGISTETAKRIKSHLSAFAMDDMTPALKRPLDTNAFERFLQSLADLVRSSTPTGLRSNGHFVEEWDTMDQTARADYLKGNVDSIVSQIFMDLSRATMEVYSTYAMDAAEKHFQGMPLEPPVDPKEVVYLGNLSKRAKEERRTIEKRVLEEERTRDAQEQVRDRLEVEGGLALEDLDPLIVDATRMEIDTRPIVSGPTTTSAKNSTPTAPDPGSRANDTVEKNPESSVPLLFLGLVSATLLVVASLFLRQSLKFRNRKVK